MKHGHGRNRSRFKGMIQRGCAHYSSHEQGLVGVLSDTGGLLRFPWTTRQLSQSAGQLSILVPRTCFLRVVELYAVTDGPFLLFALLALVFGLALQKPRVTYCVVCDKEVTVQHCGRGCDRWGKWWSVLLVFKVLHEGSDAVEPATLSLGRWCNEFESRASLEQRQDWRRQCIDDGFGPHRICSSTSWGVWGSKFLRSIVQYSV